MSIPGLLRWTCMLLFLSSSLLAQEKGLTPVDVESTSTMGTTYAVVVGISDYQDEGIPDLRFADKDAIAFANFLRSPAGGELDDDHLKVLLNDRATAAQFAMQLDWLWEVAGENDRVIIYFSGHGDVERKSITQPGYLLCWDAPAQVYMAGGAFNVRDLKDVISTLSIQNKARVLLITDACRSGKLSGNGIGGAHATAANLTQQFANEIKILSCQPDEYSIEGEQWGGGRGAFSYHLLDGLFGMADMNIDKKVNLMEMGRYLEDHVTIEVAPHSQIPLIVGNKGDTLTDVLPELLAQLKDRKKGDMSIFASTESRGIEAEVLQAADSNIVAQYNAFLSALDQKNFLEPKGKSADDYFLQLCQEPQLTRLHSSMRRNYAAALQDDAQQLMNDWMRSGKDVASQDSKQRPAHLPLLVYSKKVESFPRYLERAAELLGEGHYMYATLMARMHFFKGYILTNIQGSSNEQDGQQALTQFKKALEWQPELPQAYWQMINVYGFHLLQPDSAEIMAQKAIELYPNWVRPYTGLAFVLLTEYNRLDQARPYLEMGLQVDSTSVAVWNTWGIYHILKKEYPQAEKCYMRALELDSTNSIFYAHLARVYKDSRHAEKAELNYQRAIELDSTNFQFWVGLGNLYMRNSRYTESEECYRMAIGLNPDRPSLHNELGYLYLKTGRYIDAEKCFLRSLKLDTTYASTYAYLGNIGMYTRRDEMAEHNFRKAIELKPSYWIPYGNLAVLYQRQGRWEEVLTMIEKCMERTSANSVFIALQGNAFSHLPGQLDKAWDTLTSALEMSPEDPDTYVYLAIWSLKKNQLEDAWNYLEQGLEKGIGNGELTVEDLQEVTDFSEIRKDPRWQALIQKYFPDQPKK
ncbi:MAG: tetratricopeptide repeat protein [Saprospiraceae bacterium]|nr:tetratricopeptide repeat protein [Saprospiraceae bacterium]